MAKKKANNVKVQFIGSVKEWHEQGGEDVKIPKFDFITVTKNHVKRYHNCLSILFGISGAPRNLLDYLVETMGEHNLVSNNELVRAGFQAACKQAGIEIYSDSTVKEAYKELVKVGFLTPVKRGFYLVNPVYFFSGEERERVKMIKITLEFEAGTSTAFQITKK